MTADGASPLGAAGVLDLRTVVGARLSDDATQVVYAVSTVSEDRRADRVQLNLVEVESARSRELTAADACDTAPVWLPDGSAIVFRSTRSGTPQIHRVDLASGDVEQLSEHPFGVGPVGAAVCPAGERIAFTAPAREPADPSQPYRVADGIWRLDGVGRLDLAAMEVHVMPAAGGAARRLTEAGAVPVSIQWSPDGRQILHLCFKGADAPTYQLWIYDLSAETDTLIWEGEFQGFPPAAAWLPDGRVVRSTTNLVVPQAVPSGIVVTEAAPGATEDVRSAGIDGWLFPLLQGDFAFAWQQAPRIVVAPDGHTAFVSAQRGGSVEVWSIALDGPDRSASLISGEQVSFVVDAAEELLLLATSTLHEPVDLWVARQDGSEPRRLTRLNDSTFGPERHFAVQRLDVVAEDGTEVDAWFLAPRGAEGPLPTVLANHGGPHAAWGHVFSYDFAMLAAAGYATLLVNGRGSLGYSRHFADQIHGDLGNLDISDLESAVDLAVAEGLADPGALAARGLSNGGFLTAWLTARSDRFKAAVIENGVLDLNASLGADVGYVMFPGWMTGGPSHRAARPADRTELSPTSFAERCTTPTLVIQHEQDLRCPPTNGDLLFALLKAAGCTTEMLRMPDSSHNGSLALGSPVTRVAENEALLNWLERYL